MQCLPDSLLGREYYRPTEQGVEGKFKARLQQIKDVEGRARGEVRWKSAGAQGSGALRVSSTLRSMGQNPP